MKFIKYILAGFICVVAINSCNLNLDLTNPNELSPDTFFQNEVQLKSAVNASYTSLQTRGLYARHMFFMMDNMAHENGGNPQLEADKAQYLTFSWPTSHGAIFSYWDVCYRGINKANFAIDNAMAMEDGLVTESTRQKYIGEAKFMRALYYYLLVTRFGDVPLYTTVATEGAAKTAKSEVYAQIINDLSAAATSLLDKGSEEFGRATKGAAFALLGKVHLTMGNHQLALDAFANVYGKYSLVDNYFDNFMDETEDNDETIFDIMFSSKYGGADSWGTTGSGIAEVTFRDQEYGMTWFNVYPSDMLLDEFEANDPRYADSFYTTGDITANGDLIDVPLSRRAAWKKYHQYYKQANSNTESGINFNYLRYADVLLMMAECENEVGTGATAIGYLNEVRARASVDMPRYGTPAMDAIYPVSNKAEIFTAIVHERAVELAGEQVRYNDLIRWDMADDVLSQFGFVKGKHEIFPIPQNEIDANLALSNADQNPGY
ncbi:MAG: RagB/SusD family nutrient uptake outer membrane protein [Cyclobacteriaceae bacterium]|nr:RagB/SusD family nutrient uptake outer membrane protein [Cyclobacteriaceae bacterium]MCK5370036.1 RagB/SusD family nutrient uptake outer membrane protein [Cyclobacteriaceae bacterium]MCK5470010.1 RagB/SusD family nutrient uptake outer membrane protein [Cyclobacteriaceae bacterium]